MGIGYFGGIVLLCVVFFFFIEAYIQLWMLRFFGVTEANLKTSAKIVLWLLIPNTFLALPLFIGFEFVGAVLLFFVFDFLIKKYFPQTSFKQNLKIYVSICLTNVLLALVTVIPIRAYLVEPFVVSGAAMTPTYVGGDYLFIKKYDRTFDRGDVVVLRSPIDPSEFFIKRIVGLPNEKVSFVGGRVFINDNPIQEEYLDQETKEASSVFLGSDEYFVMGDNRASSSDSRIWGPVKQDFLTGKVWKKVF